MQPKAHWLDRQMSRSDTIGTDFKIYDTMANRFLHAEATRLYQHPIDVQGTFPPGFLDLPLRAGETPLGFAAAEGTADDVGRLVALGADPNTPDLRGIPPIVHAAIAQNLGTILSLVEAGADVDATDANGRTALHYVFLFGDGDIMQVLLSADADMTATDIDGRAVIDYARATFGDKDEKLVAQVAQEILDTEAAMQEEADAADEDDEKPNPLPELRGDPDFQMLDRVQQAEAYAFDGVSTITIYMIFRASILIGVGADNAFAGLVALYVILFGRMIARYFSFEKTDAPLSGALPAGASVREVSFILRAASRHVFSKLDDKIEARADTGRMERKLWLFAALAPLAGVLTTGIICAVVAGLIYLLTFIPILGWIVGGIIGITVALAAPRFVFGIMEIVFSWGAVPQLVSKITARQSALSDFINSKDLVRDGGDFTDGGVLYLRSFEFDGSFVTDGLDFELLLMHLFQDHAPIFALNADPTSRGTLNLKTSDSDWRAVVDDMIPRAGMILMIPAVTAGVREEIGTLERDGWFQKTLFIAPPENDEGTVGPAWEEMRHHPDLRHLEIPPFCDAGFLFRLDDQGVLLEAGPLGIDRSPLPLLEPEELEKAKHDPDLEFDGDGVDVAQGQNDGGWADGAVVSDGGAGAASGSAAPVTASTTHVVASSTVQFSSLTMLMQSAQVMTPQEFQTLTGGDIVGVGGDDGGGDGGGAM